MSDHNQFFSNQRTFYYQQQTEKIMIVFVLD